MTTTDTEFAAAVLKSAAAVGSDGLARIDTVYDWYAAIYESCDIETFKARLWNVAKAGRLMLASLDMPQTLTTAGYANLHGRSLIVKGASQFRAVRYSQPAPFAL